MNVDRPFLSIVIPAYNAAGELVALLQSIQASTFDNWEVLVVDDGSTDGTIGLVEALPVRVLRTPRNGGPAGARNLGARAARGDILLFLDSDVLLEPETLGEVASFFRSRPDRSVMIGVYSPEPANEGPWPLYKALQCYSYYRGFPPVKDVTLLWAAVAAFRREAFLASGGFDERFGRPSMEDLELGRRISGTTPIALNRRVVVRHRFPETWRKNAADHYDRGRLWVRIYFRYRRFDNYLSTPRRAAGRLAASAALPLLAAAPFAPAAGIASGALFGAYLACNHDLWSVTARRLPRFLPRALVYDFTLGVVLGAAALVACAEEVAERGRALFRPATREEDGREASAEASFAPLRPEPEREPEDAAALGG
jgi:glycosyltransferase involved in cell wall biosynthesis